MILENFIDDLQIILKETGIGIKGYLKGQLKLMLLTFIILSVGFWYIQIPLYILIALGIAIIDIIPVIGSGIIMVPWSIIAFFMDNKNMAMEIAILYVVLTIIRQILEPKIIGDSIGLRPLYTFLSTLLGSILLGPFGVILGPIIGIFINAVYLRRKVKGIEENRE